MSTDIFNLLKSTTSVCSVIGYTISRSSLYVKVDYPDQTKSHLLRFMDVVYIQTPMTWIGNNFSSEEKDISLNLLKQIEDWHTLPEDMLREYQLYVNHLGKDRCQDLEFRVISVFGSLDPDVRIGTLFSEIVETPQAKTDSDLFNLPNLDESHCHIVGYMMKNYPYLSIEVTFPNLEKIYLNFEGVEYLDCPVGWTGAKFSIMKNDMLSELADCLSKPFSDSLKLFSAPITRVATTKKQVRILAKKMHITSERPYFCPDWTK